MNHKERPFYKNQIKTALRRNPIVGILGPRQSGKTTLAREVSSEMQVRGVPIHYFDLEHPQDVLRLNEPVQALEDLTGLIVIDEVQRRPNLYPYLRVLADRPEKKAQFLILGSASGDLLKQTSESLAGRIEYIELQGFCINEVDAKDFTKLWIRGGYPKSFLAENEEDSFAWRDGLIRMFIERDVPLVWERIPSVEMWRVWQMTAHYHGQTLNYSEMSRSLGIGNKIIQQYIGVLTEMFMVRQLPPWYENVGKRMVKSPKFYIRDSGLLHTLLGLKTREEVERYPRLGALWEGFALEQVLRVKGDNWRAFFWADQSSGEMDLILNEGGDRIGYEFKFADAPDVTKSMMIAKEALGLKRILIVIPRGKRYKLRDYIEVVPLDSVLLD